MEKQFMQKLTGTDQFPQQEKIVFTKSELEQKVKVPAVVEQDLKRIISDRLEQCGLYFRVFSRTKTAASMARKFDLKEYGEDHKLQDLVGVRINVYFDDDVEICRNIMEHTFEVIEWSTSTRTEDEFKPIKLNGVFRLPEYLRAKISPETWDMYIDNTFEIQLKTMFFEGWHEIEHDMRYKEEELWKDNPGFLRFFNSILATLELCDKSMVSLFEDLGHELYKNGNWTDMIRSHFRLKMGDAPLYPEVERLLTEDQQKTVDSIAKRIYKTSKSTLIDLLLRRGRRVPINVNTIIALLNDGLFHDERLQALMQEMDVYNDGREESVGESRLYEMRPLQRHDVFRMKTWVDGSRIRGEEAVTVEGIFQKAVRSMYHWLLNKYSPLFPELPREVCTWREDKLGYYVDVRYNGTEQIMQMHVRHLDLVEAGRVWYSDACLKPDDQGRIILNTRNGYADGGKDYGTEGSTTMFFSYPGYYKSIVDSVGVRSGIRCSNRRRILSDDQIPELIGAIRNPENRFPVIVIISEETVNGQMDEGWLGALRVSDFIRTVWRYAHVFSCYEEDGRAFLKEIGLDGENAHAVPRVYVFWPDGSLDSYGPEDVAKCSFGRHLETQDDNRTYDIVHGGQAFYHQLVTDLREWNVQCEIDTSGFVAGHTSARCDLD